MLIENDKFNTEKIVNEILEQGEIFNDIEEDLLHELIGSKISKDNVKAHTQTLTFGDRMADKIAAIQAPVIMMSQNRQEIKDRIKSKNDYKINLKWQNILTVCLNNIAPPACQVKVPLATWMAPFILYYY